MSTTEHRPIRSFVLRQGRTSTAQQRAVDTLLPEWGIAYEPRLLDLDITYGRHAPHIVEIGFGMGETTAAIAQSRPEVDYLGIEVHRPGVGNLLKLIDAEGLTNIRIVQHDAVEVLTHMIAPASLDGLHLFFPDPWPKTRHHKRRLVQPAFVAMVATRLKPGGYVHMATDWVDYAEQMLTVLSSEPALQNAAVDYAPRPESRPRTKFESRGLRLGHDVRDLLFRRRPIE